ncbi:MAG: hypothetical protein NTV81_02535, partial [Candidatus Komeilibacteria bacterium]|nr:hypothetical protein [Candidatus Komeilibacteria bacterium]
MSKKVLKKKNKKKFLVKAKKKLIRTKARTVKKVFKKKKAVAKKPFQKKSARPIHKVKASSVPVVPVAEIIEPTDEQLQGLITKSHTR